MSEATRFIASCSGGKDSVVTLLLAQEHGEPLDEVVYCEVMFDQDTSAEVPEHRAFIYRKIKPFVENVLGVPFTILQSTKTYTDVFRHTITRGPNFGKTHGFVIPGMCAVNRDCKIPPIRAYWRGVGGDVVQYVGIAADETERLERMRGTNQISLLKKYDITEADAVGICVKAGLYSPIYEFSARNGCWFCPNCNDREWSHIIFNHPQLFDRLVDMERNTPNIYRTCLTRTETPTQLRQRIQRQGFQRSIFEKME